MQAADYHALLMDTYHFTAEDLVFNQRGMLSELQQIRLRQRFNGRYSDWTLWAWLVVALSLCCACWSLPLIDNPLSGTSLLCGFGFLAMVGWVALWIGLGELRWMQRGEPVVEKICARLRPVQTDLLIAQVFTLHFEQQKFRVSEREFQVVQEGRAYCVYYHSRLRMIMSIEPMEG